MENVTSPPRQEDKELAQKVGLLIVVTGYSGSGKDHITGKALGRENIVLLNLDRLVTCTSRELDPKRGEVEGKDYFFMSEQEIFRMHENDELVEIPLKYGGSYKASPKKEFKKVLEEGARKIWRIDPSLAAKVADGSFWDEQFPENSDYFKEHTIVFLIDVTEDQLRQQQKDREGNQYEIHKKEYEDRIEQDLEHIAKLRKRAVVIQNIYKHDDEAASQMAAEILKHYVKLATKDQKKG